MAQQLTGHDVCASIHVALRKCCDSTATSLLWNLIHSFDDVGISEWHRFGDLVAARLTLGDDPVSAMTTAAENLCNADLTRRNLHAAMVIELTFALFSCEDWEGAAAFLSDDG